MPSSPKARQPSVPQSKIESNPFETASDNTITDDEWWEEDDTDDSPDSESSSRIQSAEWPKPPEGTGLGLTMKPSTRNKRYSVQKLTRDKSKGRQKKLLAKAGIKIITNSPQQGVAPQGNSQTMPEMARFVDYATLKALGGETPGGFWKGKKSNNLSRAGKRKPSISNGSNSQHKAMPSTSSQKSLAPQQNENEDLSPGDRPIVIGISIPTSDLAGHTLSPQTASSDTSKIVRSYELRTPTVPDTPTIIITPAQESPAWSPQSQGSLHSNSRQRAPSSGYSNLDAHFTASDAPPVPQMPYSFLEDERQRIAAQKSYFSPDSDDVSTWDDETPTTSGKSRVTSSCTIFEEDESPIIAKAGRAISISAGSKPDLRGSINTVATGRLSKGWWNYITTPFLTRSNTFAARDVEDQNPPALPSLAIAAAKAQDAARTTEPWEKEFSPLTPVSAIAATEDPWWKLDQKPQDQASSPVLQETRHKVQTSTGTLPIILAEVASLKSASTTSLVPENETQLSRENTTLTLPFVLSKEEESRRPNSRELQSNNPFLQLQNSHVEEHTDDTQPANRQATTLAGNQSSTNPPVITPPPPYSPSPTRQKQYRAILPPGHISSPQQSQQPASPGPVSPGLHEATMSSGGIPLSTVPLTPPARRPINLNSSYQAELPARSNGNFSSEYLNAAARAASKKAKKAEEKRQRHEKEEAIAHRAGGLWRGRGCISDRGCYGRSGAEGRKRRRWYFALITIFLFVIILAVVLATTLHRRTSTVAEPSQWLNLTGFPPIFLGLSTIVAPTNIKTNTGCVFPATQWSCALPKELQSSISPNSPNQPNFFLEIQWDNSSAANSTFQNVTGSPNLVTRRAGNPVSAGQFIRHLFLKARQIIQFSPSPDPPSFAEEAFLGSTTDDIVSDNKAGEPTPFYISFLSKANTTVSKRQVIERVTDPFPNISAVIPAPSLNSDGTAASANLLPFPTQQPIRLYDRGLPTEHYGFYTYFDRSVFLKSITPLNSSNLDNGEVPDDENGGATESEANFRCTWSQTRFLVQMWTRMNTTSQLLNTTSHKPGAATALQQPGTFPYPVTITLDRHGGNPDKKLLYCYSMNSREGIDASTGVLVSENRGFGGTLINPAADVFSNTSDSTRGGFDGGNGGCACQWSNFITTVTG